MPDQNPKRIRISRILTGEPIQVGGRTIQPVARADGWYGVAAGETGAGAGGWVHLAPLDVLVQEADGSQHRLPITDPNGEALRKMFGVMLPVAGVCLAIMAIVAVARAMRR